MNHQVVHLVRDRGRRRVGDDFLPMNAHIAQSLPRRGCKIVRGRLSIVGQVQPQSGVGLICGNLQRTKGVPIFTQQRLGQKIKGQRMRFVPCQIDDRLALPVAADRAGKLNIRRGEELIKVLAA